MPLRYKLLLFYSLITLLAFDLYAVGSRYSLLEPDPVSLSKTFFALLFQLIAVLVATGYLYWLGVSGRTIIEVDGPVYSFGWRIAPIVAAAILAAYGYQMLFNAWNCGSRPLPTNRGVPTCPASAG